MFGKVFGPRLPTLETQLQDSSPGTEDNDEKAFQLMTEEYNDGNNMEYGALVHELAWPADGAPQPHTFYPADAGVVREAYIRLRTDYHKALTDWKKFAVSEDEEREGLPFRSFTKDLTVAYFHEFVFTQLPMHAQALFLQELPQPEPISALTPKKKRKGDKKDEGSGRKRSRTSSTAEGDS